MTGLSDDAVRGVVLAGGGATRFGDGDKALADVGDRPILARVVDELAAATGTRPVVAVRTETRRERYESALAEATGAAAPSVDPVYATDAADSQGPLAGLLGACAAVDESWLFVTACDVALLDRDAVSWVLERRHESGVDAVVPRRESRLEPLHAAYRREAVGAARDALAENASLHVLLDELDAVEAVDPAEWPAGFDRSLRDVNTTADLEAIRASVDEAETD